jgi:ATP-dependent Clp protease ATP-binding subunit ClpA
MKAQIFGHDTTIDGIVETIKRAELRPTSGKTPLASLLFAGPSGVGKTATATALATHLYHDPKALIRLDMSEFSEGHGVSKLLGSPAGYVGYKERNRFFEAIEKRPYCVILFDEFDKAHPDVRKLLLQILDEGSLTDSRGKTISFRHAIIVLTTNIGEKFFRSSGIGFANQSPSNDRVSPLNNIAITAALTDELGQALMTRIKHTALFGPLSEESIKHIIRYRLSHLLKDLKTSRDITIKAPERTITALTKSLYKPNISARHIDAAIESILYEQVIHALATSDEQQFTLTKKQDTFVLS